jgi:hypothetical protein
MTEDDLLRAVLDLAKVYGWRTYHARLAITAKGYRTPVQGDGKGFPDLLMVKGADLLAIELKSDKGRPSAEQQDWLAAFGPIALESNIWRPADWHSGEILRVLSGA